MTSVKELNSRWRKFCENLNNLVLTMDHNPTQPAQHRIRALERELVDINTRLDQLTAKQPLPQTSDTRIP